MSTGQTEGHQAPPIVNNGYMYVTTPGAQVIALDAATGTELWRYKKEIPGDLMQLHPTNRGVALYGDKVYVATVDAHLVALDAKTGKVAWTKQVGDSKALQYMTLAPLAAKGKIMVGSSGGETGVRGYVAAFDAETGRRLWSQSRSGEPLVLSQPGVVLAAGAVAGCASSSGAVVIIGPFPLGLDLRVVVPRGAAAKARKAVTGSATSSASPAK